MTPTICIRLHRSMTGICAASPDRDRPTANRLGWRVPVSLRFRARVAAISSYLMVVIGCCLILLAVALASRCLLSLPVSWIGPRHLDLSVAIC